VSPPQSTGCSPIPADAVRIGALLVDLVNRDEHRDVGFLGVVDRLLGLWLDAVIGGHHDHCEVGHLRAASAHGGERLVARSVEEGDRVIAVVHLVGANVLGDPARLSGSHLGLADRVQQRSLSVVDVAHDRHHRRALDELLLGVIEHRLRDRLILGMDDLDLLAELGRQHLDRVIRQRLSERLHFAERHQLLHQLRHRHVEILRHVLDGRSGVDRNRGPLRHRGRSRWPGLRLFVVYPAAAAAASLAPRWLGGLRSRAARAARGL
jgi:hypothetical protein